MTHQMTFDEVRRARRGDPATSKAARAAAWAAARDAQRQDLEQRIGALEPK